MRLRETKKDTLKHGIPRQIMHHVTPALRGLALRWASNREWPTLTPQTVVELCLSEEDEHMLRQAGRFIATNKNSTMSLDVLLTKDLPRGGQNVRFVLYDLRNTSYADMVWPQLTIDLDKEPEGWFQGRHRDLVDQIRVALKHRRRVSTTFTEISYLVQYVNAVCPTVRHLKALWPSFTDIFKGYIAEYGDLEPLTKWIEAFVRTEPLHAPGTFPGFIDLLRDAQGAIAQAMLAQPAAQPGTIVNNVSWETSRGYHNGGMPVVPWGGYIDWGSRPAQELMSRTMVEILV